ncbi:TIGR02206 family membrane protein [Bacillus haikouensis]|uniref:YwaF family protein n=1 Tax=Bacillus haikouensis TaxID=1510468 RepID=UPI001555B13B|nr:TIGR02206 family membrane protein [Bacillus haikouensis]NQD67675.1 TIGR02206 family membrane protein [Bacillus haikouensis]
MDWFGHSHQSFHFSLFSVSHVVTLAIFIFVAVIIFLYRKNVSNSKRRRIEKGTAYSLILMEMMNHVWMYVHDVWKFGRSMPLELCNIAVILCICLLLTRKRIFFELLFFIAVLGATQAIITPALTYDFPHFRFLHFFYSHLIAVWVTLYFTLANGYHPTFRSFTKLIVFINLLMPIILLVNMLSEGNYWFLRHKPKSPSLFDLLGPYPWYILTLESVLIVISVITWLILRKIRGTFSA